MTTDGFIGRWIRFLLYLQNMFYKVKSVPARCENHKGLGKGLVFMSERFAIQKQE